MYKALLLAVTLLLSACSATDNGLKKVDQSSRGISIINVKTNDRTKAYRIAEKHCAKYSKVPLLVKSTPQSEDSPIAMMTRKFECLRPSR